MFGFSEDASPALFRIGLLILAAALAGCAGPAPSEEFKRQADMLHEGAMKSTLLKSAAAEDDSLGRYVQQVGERVVAAAREAAPQDVKDAMYATMEFHIVAGSRPVTFTTGGKHVYVSSALLTACETEDDLAAAMCHAMAHAIRLDLQKNAKDRPPSSPDSIDRVVIYLSEINFGPAEESAAASLAASLYVHGGWEPRNFNRLSAKLGWPAAAQASASTMENPPIADEQTFTMLCKSASVAAAPDQRIEELVDAIPPCGPTATADRRATARQAIRSRLQPKVDRSRTSS